MAKSDQKLLRVQSPRSAATAAGGSVFPPAGVCRTVKAQTERQSLGIQSPRSAATATGGSFFPPAGLVPRREGRQAQGMERRGHRQGSPDAADAHEGIDIVRLETMTKNFSKSALGDPRQPDVRLPPLQQPRRGGTVSRRELALQHFTYMAFTHTLYT